MFKKATLSKKETKSIICLWSDEKDTANQIDNVLNLSSRYWRAKKITIRLLKYFVERRKENPNYAPSKGEMNFLTDKKNWYLWLGKDVKYISEGQVDGVVGEIYEKLILNNNRHKWSTKSKLRKEGVMYG